VTTAAGTEITTYIYDIADRLTQETVSLRTGGSRLVTYTYDGNGNLASKTEPGKVALYRFDPRNKLIDIRVGDTLAQAQAATPTARYAYDADGNRVRKWAAEEKGYLVDVNTVFPQVALETASTGSIQYVRGLGLIRQIRVRSAATEDLFPLHGHLGTSLGALNADGDFVEQIDSDAFGNLDQSSGLKQTHLYAGEYWDQDAQLLYLRARWYDPKIGRFISADPFEGKQSDPRSLNRYAYAHMDPVHNIDPSGMIAGGFVSGLIDLGTQFSAVLARTGSTANQARQIAARMCSIGAQLARPYNQFSQRMLRRLRSGRFEAHHVFQDARMQAAAQGYSRLTALAIPLLGGLAFPGSPHSDATLLQKMFEKANKANAPTFAQLRTQAYRVLRVAGCRNSDATEIVLAAENTLELDKVGIGF